MVNFDIDYHQLKHYSYKKNVYNLSKALKPEILKGGLDRYAELYQYFWQLIENNRKNCRHCQTQHCYNRYFFKELSQNQLSENDLYLMTYMVLYFLDLLMNIGYSQDQAYYILSNGHDYVMSILTEDTMEKIEIEDNIIDNYRGYLLSVLYYLLPNFKYKIKNRLNYN